MTEVNTAIADFLELHRERLTREEWKEIDV